MNKIVLLLMATLLPLFLVGSAFAQESIDVPIEISESELIVVIIGALGGLTTAYLGYRKARSNDPATKFDITVFADRVIIAVITSVGLAIGVATEVLVLNFFTMYLIFVSSIGTSELVMELRNRNGSRTK